jgi:hypothetical protein
MSLVRKNLVAGCSFTDPTWQKDVPWSVFYGQQQPTYIVAKAGMGIKGICTETLYYLKTLPEVDQLILVLPTLWRMDIEVDEETYLSNAMVDLLTADQPVTVASPAKRKWITSGGLRYPKDKEYSPTLDFLYKHQGFLVIAKEHFRALTMLLEYCKINKIKYAISAIQDPLDQLEGLDYIRDKIVELLNEVEYNSWFRFDGKFIDKYLKHNQHPSTEEHKDLCRCIVENLNRG